MKYLLSISALLTAAGMSALDFGGTALKPVEVTVEASTGLDAVYVVADTHGATMTYTASSATSAVKWSRYSRMGAAYAEEVAPVRDGAKLTVPCTDDDMGYVIEENGRSRYN